MLIDTQSDQRPGVYDDATGGLREATEDERREALARSAKILGLDADTYLAELDRIRDAARLVLQNAPTSPQGLDARNALNAALGGNVAEAPSMERLTQTAGALRLERAKAHALLREALSIVGRAGYGADLAARIDAELSRAGA